jgi:Ran GTPase-activating protein (RanGAP) involved in mRNA processing and transport
MGMDRLLKLSARGNRIDKLDLTVSNWSKLEHLELPENGLGEVVGLEQLKGLVSLNLGKLVSALRLSARHTADCTRR